MLRERRLTHLVLLDDEPRQEEGGEHATGQGHVPVLVGQRLEPVRARGRNPGRAVAVRLRDLRLNLLHVHAQRRGRRLRWRNRTTVRGSAHNHIP